jgi:hypothetical protein
MTTISQAQQMVTQFHDHCKLRQSAKLGEEMLHADYLRGVVKTLKVEAELLMNCLDDPIGLRMHLELEELAEKFQAMLDGDEVEAVDGAADQLYVMLGTAAYYDWPIETAFEEVHASNMTKEKQPSDPHAQRLRAKGPGYKPPNIERVLTSYRCWRQPHAFAPDDLYSPYCECGKTQNDPIHITQE